MRNRLDGQEYQNRHHPQTEVEADRLLLSVGAVPPARVPAVNRPLQNEVRLRLADGARNGRCSSVPVRIDVMDES